jgi:hypothetical protein
MNIIFKNFNRLYFIILKLDIYLVVFLTLVQSKAFFIVGKVLVLQYK